MASVSAIDIPPGKTLPGPLQRQWHNRGNQAYIVHDVATNSLILAQKLAAVASYLNEEYARNPFERVSARGLYEAADKHDGYTGGLHKMRYLVSRCDLDTAHIAFEHARDGVDKATVLLVK